MPGPERVTFTVADADAGRRLDQVLAARVPGLSRRQARVLLDIGGVFVDGRRVKVAGPTGARRRDDRGVVGGALARATGRPGRAARDDDERRLPPYAVVYRGRRPGRRRQASRPPDRADAGERPQQPGVAAGAARKQRSAASSSSTASTSRRAASSCSPRPRTPTASSPSGSRRTILERAYLAAGDRERSPTSWR